MQTKLTILAAVALLLPALAAEAQSGRVPAVINYQGVLSDGAGAPYGTGEYSLTFRVYDDVSGGTLRWGPQVFDLDDGAPPQVGHARRVPVVVGRFNVILGPEDESGRSLVSAFREADAYLEIEIEGGIITPRQRILSAPFAAQAEELGGGAVRADPSGEVSIGRPGRAGSLRVQDAGGAPQIAVTADGLESPPGRPVRLNGSSGADVVIALGGGNVGIGTDTPGAHLDVAGDVNAARVQATDVDASGQVRAGNLVGIGGAGMGLLVKTGTVSVPWNAPVQAVTYPSPFPTRTTAVTFTWTGCEGSCNGARPAGVQVLDKAADRVAIAPVVLEVPDPPLAWFTFDWVAVGD